MLRSVPTYDLGPVEPAPPVPRTPLSVDKPSWARGLPSHATLVYVRDLGTATIVTLLGVYLVMRILRDPSAGVRALRQRAGV